LRPCDTCGTLFKPYHSKHRCCSKKCQINSADKKGYTRQYQQNRKHLLNQMKVDRGCAHCGYNAHPAALDWDHIDRSTKSFLISQDSKRSWGKLMEEVDKCQVLCANCHRIHTYENKHNAPRL
jgi:hypothetical protein